MSRPVSLATRRAIKRTHPLRTARVWLRPIHDRMIPVWLHFDYRSEAELREKVSAAARQKWTGATVRIDFATATDDQGGQIFLEGRQDASARFGVVIEATK